MTTHAEGAARRSRLSASAAQPLAIHFAALAAVCLIDFLFRSAVLTLMLGGTIVMFAYAAICLIESKRAPLMLSPLSFYFAWYAVALGLSALYIGGWLRYDDSIPFTRYDVWSDDVAAGYIVFLVGSLCLHCGIQTFRPSSKEQKHRPPRAGVWHAGRLASIGVSYLFGVSYLLHPTPFAVLGTLVGPLDFIGIAALSVFALTDADALGLSGSSFTAILSLLTGGLFVASLNTGFKVRIMFSILPMLWLFVTRRSLWRWFPVMLVGGTLMYSSVYRAVTLARTVPHDESETPLSKIVEAYWAISAGQAPDQTALDQVETLLYREFDSLPVGFFVQEVRERGLMYGRTMAYAFYAWIPRFLWPDKPIVSHGAWFTAYLGMAKDASVAGSWTEETAIGELYWNFGIPGVIVGMTLIGTLIGILWQMAGSRPDRVSRMLLYVMVMLEMPDQAEAVTTVIALIANLAIFGAFFTAANTLGSLGTMTATRMQTRAASTSQ